MHECPPTEVLQLLLDEELPVAAAEAFEGHLQTCRACERRLDQLASAGRVPLPPGAFGARAISEPAAPDADSPWPAVPGYEIVGKLGQGGCSVVYKARQIGLDRWVALKMLLGGAHATPPQRARFLAEARTVAALHHPHIVQIHDIGEHAGVPFFALELIEGGTLRTRLAGNPMPARAAAELLERLALAMAVAHQQGIIHRDLKPDNILLVGGGVVSREWSGASDTSSSPLTTHHSPRTTHHSPRTTHHSRTESLTPKITDFGIATRPEGSVGLTRSGEILGTPCYMAPEQVSHEAGQVGPATDVHGLGAILYELLTGRPPFLGETPLETLELVKSADPIAPSRLRSNLPPDLETICLKCLHNDPARRYAGAAALAADLRSFLRGEPIVARPTSRLERGWRWCRRQPVVAGLLAALFLVLVAGCGVGVCLWLQAEHAWRDAVASDDAARRLLTELIQTSPVIPLHPGFYQVTPRIEPLLEARAHCRKLLSSQPHDLQLRIALSNVDGRLGTLYGRREQWTAAQDCFQEALDLWAPLVRQEPSNPDYRDWLATAYLWQASAASSRENFPVAVEAMQQTDALRQELAEEQPDHFGFMRNAAESQASLFGMANTPLGHDAYLRSMDSYRRTVEQRLHTQPQDRVARRRLALLSLIEGDLRQERHAADAVVYWQQAHDQYVALLASRPSDLLLQYPLAVACARLMKSRTTDPLYREAVNHLSGVIRTIETLIEQHPEEDWLRNLQDKAYGCLASCHARAGDAARARQVAQKHVRILLARLEDQPIRPDGTRRLPTLMQLANALATCGQDKAAVARLREAAALTARYATYPELDHGSSSWLASMCLALSARLNQLGDPASSLTTADQARRLLEEPGHVVPTDGVVGSMLSGAWERMAKARWNLGQRDEALAAFRQAAAIQKLVFEREPSSAPQHQKLSRCYDRLVNWGRQRGDWAGAAAALHEREQLWLDNADELREIARDFRALAKDLTHSRESLSVSESAQRRHYLAEAERLDRQARTLTQPRQNP